MMNCPLKCTLYGTLTTVCLFIPLSSEQCSMSTPHSLVYIWERGGGGKKGEGSGRRAWKGGGKGMEGVTVMVKVIALPDLLIPDRFPAPAEECPPRGWGWWGWGGGSGGECAYRHSLHTTHQGLTPQYIFNPPVSSMCHYAARHVLNNHFVNRKIFNVTFL